MLACVVIFSFDPPRASPCRHVTKISSPQPLLFLSLTNRDARNSFGIRSYANCRVSSSKPVLFPHSLRSRNVSGFDLSPFFLILSGHTFATKTHQPLCIQSVMRSFHADGGGPPLPRAMRRELPALDRSRRAAQRAVLHRHIPWRRHQVPDAPEFPHLGGSAERDADIFVHRGNRRGHQNIVFFKMR